VRFIFSALTLVVVIAALLFFAGPLLFSADDVRDKLLAQVESMTGYRLRVDGPVKLSLFPSLNLTAEDVGVARGAAPENEIATAQKLRVDLVLSALWNGKVQLTELTLIDPVIAVPATEPSAEADGEGGGRGAGEGPASAASTLQSMTLDKLVIQNGTVILPPSGQTPGKRIEKLNLEASLPAFDAPLTFDTEAVFDGKPVAVAGSIGNFGGFLGGTAAPVALAIGAPAYLPDKIDFKGTATYASGTLLLNPFSARAGDKSVQGAALYKDGTVTLQPFTLKTAEATVEGNATYKDGLVTVNPFTARTADAVVQGSATYKDNILNLPKFTAKAYGNAFSGALAADISGKVPAINAALAADTVNVDALLAGSGGSKAKTSGGGGDGSGGGGSGWSDAPIDFGPLRMVNGKLKLTAKTLVYDKVKISPVNLDATLSGGKLNAQLPGIGLYGGKGNAALAVDASGKTPAQRVKLDLAKFEAYPFLRDVAGFHNIEGTGTIGLDLAASGVSQRAMIHALGGNAKFDFANGAIRGLNVAKTVRNLTQGTLTGWQESAAEKTDFAALGASFKIAGGQAQTSDLNLVGPLVRMTGAGTVNLSAKSLKFRVEPQIVASLEGQGGKTDLKGLGVPIVIAGPWAAPRIYPDIKGILENPAQAYDQLRQLGGGLVSLPGIDKLGEKVGIGGATGSVPLQDIVKDGKINKDALRQGAIEGLGALINNQKPGKQAPPPPADNAAVQPPAQPAAAPVAEPAAAPPPAAAPAPAKKKKQKPEDIAKDVMKDLLFGNR
jgi:AsmA protein